MSEVVDHKRRWARITSTRLQHLSDDMRVSPISEVDTTAWGQLRLDLERMAQHIREVCP